jgi:hypothetical protein
VYTVADSSTAHVSGCCCLLQGNSHYTDWSAGGWHPKTFAAQDLSLPLVTAMRAGVPLEVAQQAAAQQTMRSHGMPHSSGSREQASAEVHAGQVQPPMPHYKADWSARLPAPKFAAAVAQCNSAQALSTATSRVFQLSSAGRAQLASQDAAHGQQLQALSMKQSGRPALLAGDAGVFATGQGGSSSAQAADHWLTAAGFLPLDQRCPLFARKFPATAQQEVLLYALGCAGLGLGSWCNRIRI